MIGSDTLFRESAIAETEVQMIFLEWAMPRHIRDSHASLQQGNISQIHST